MVEYLNKILNEINAEVWTEKKTILHLIELFAKAVYE